MDGNRFSWHSKGKASAVNLYELSCIIVKKYNLFDFSYNFIFVDFEKQLRFTITIVLVSHCNLKLI